MNDQLNNIASKAEGAGKAVSVWTIAHPRTALEIVAVIAAFLLGKFL